MQCSRMMPLSVMLPPILFLALHPLLGGGLSPALGLFDSASHTLPTLPPSLHEPQGGMLLFHLRDGAAGSARKEGYGSACWADRKRVKDPVLREGLLEYNGAAKEKGRGGVLRVRGGSAIPKGSCYPLHGAGDTDAFDFGNYSDPYSVHAVAAKIPFQKMQIDAAYLDAIQEDPKDFMSMIGLAQIVKGLRNDHLAAEAWVCRAYAIQPSHWWFQQHAHKYVRPEVLAALQERHREDIMRKHIELMPTDEMTPEQLQNREMQLQHLAMLEAERIQATVQAEQVLREQQMAVEAKRQADVHEQERLAEQEYDRLQMTKEQRVQEELRKEYRQAARGITRRQLNVRFQNNEQDEEVQLNQVYDKQGNIKVDEGGLEMAPEDGAYADGNTGAPKPPPPAAAKPVELSAMEKVKERLLRERHGEGSDGKVSGNVAIKTEEGLKPFAMQGEKRNQEIAGRGKAGGKKVGSVTARLMEELERGHELVEDRERDDDAPFEPEHNDGQTKEYVFASNPWEPDPEFPVIQQHFVEWEEGIYDDLEEHRNRVDCHIFFGALAGKKPDRPPAKRMRFKERMLEYEAKCELEEARRRAMQPQAGSPPADSGTRDGMMDDEDQSGSPPATPRQQFVQTSPNVYSSAVSPANSPAGGSSMPPVGAYVPDEEFFFEEENTDVASKS